MAEPQTQQSLSNQDEVLAQTQAQTCLLIEIRDQLTTVNKDGVLTKAPLLQAPTQAELDVKAAARKLQEIANALQPVPLGI
jgi:hypothetical protein